MIETDPLLQITLIALSGLAAQWVSWRFHLPAIIFLMVAGFLLGPATNLIHPHDLMKDLFHPAISVAVAIILFEGSLQLQLKELKEAGRAVRHIVLFGAPAGWALISAAAHYIAGLSWPVAITFGGLLVVTGPTVIMPLLRQARLNNRVSAILKWEGIVNDPLGVLFAVLAFDYFVFIAEPSHTGDSLFLIQNILILLIMGLGSFILGLVLTYILEHGLVPEFLKPPFLVSTVIALLFTCNQFIHESGLVAVTILGMTLANRHFTSIEEIRRFKETVTIMLVSGVFILLTADLDPALLLNIDTRSLLFIIALLFLIRPLTIAFSSIGTKMNWKEILFIGWIAPRGIVCAATAGILGPQLVAAGFPDGEKILPTAFAIVILTVFLHGLSAKILGKKLNLASQNTNGLIIVGASAWALQLVQTLKERDIQAMIVDTNWHRLRKARLADIPVYYGEVLSEETEFALEFNQYNTLLAATDNPAYNALVCSKFAHEFSRERVFQLGTDEEEDPERKRIAAVMQGRTFVDQTLTATEIWHRFAKGWTFRAARIGAAPDTGELVKPANDENNIIIGFIRKDSLTFIDPTSPLKQGGRENDIALFFSAEK